MCSSGGGNSFIESLVDIGSQYFTYGTVGYKSDEGGISPGIVGQAAIDITKDLTGASAAEEANKLATEQFQEEKTAALQQREDAKAQTAAEQLSISRQASASRAGGIRPTGSRSSGLGGEERDFLGL